MRILGLSNRHGGITTSLILYVILGFLLFSVPPALVASGADTVYDIRQIGSTIALNEISSFPEQYQYDIDVQYDSTNYRAPGKYTKNVQRPDVSVADNFQSPDVRIEEPTTDDWQSTDYDPIPLGDIPHGAIDIDDDSDFAGQGWPGFGTEGTPYLIENLLIDKGGAAGYCISIRNTQVYFVLRNCTITGASTSNAAGIFLNHVENGRIEECDFYNNYYGVYINASSDCTLYDCYFGDSSRAGKIEYSTSIVVEQCTFSELSHSIILYTSDYIEVQSCTFTGGAPSDSGLYIFYSDYCTIEDSEFINYVTEAILVQNSFYNTISECNFTNNDMGLWFDSTYGEVSHNYFKNNTVAGMVLNGMEIQVYENTFYRNGDYGLRVLHSSDCIIVNNIITETTGIGIGYGWESYVYASSVSTLFSNNTCVNNGYGITLVNDGTGNTFSDNNCSYNTFDGIYIENCDSNTLTENTCNFNGRHGIVLFSGSSLNTLSDNDCSQNQVGILLEDASNENTLETNTCDYCDVYAICLIDSSQNELSSNVCNHSVFDGIAVLNLSEANDFPNNTCNYNAGFGVYVNGIGSNIIEDGEYSHNLYGIYLNWTFSNVISSCLCEYNDIGILIINDYDDAFNELIDNNCNHNADTGIVLFESLENILDHNYCSDNGAGIYLSSAPLNDLMNNTCVSNTLYGIYTTDSNGNSMIDNDCSDNPYGIWIEDSNSVTIRENLLIGCTTGIVVLDSSDAYLYDNLCTGNDIGVSLTGSGYGQVLNSNCSNNAQYGIYLDTADNIAIENCEITDNDNAGIYIINTDDGSVTLNYIVENFYGVFIMSGTSNEIWDNKISENSEDGLHVDTLAVDSYVHHNKFISNFRNALDDGTTNMIQLNYWSNYTGVDADGNGIGDTPHNISGIADNADPHPLVYLPGVPVFDIDPTDQIVEFGDEVTYDLDATSSSPLKEWRIDDTEHFSISNEGVITNIVPLDLFWNEPGEYPIEVTVENIYNYTTSATFSVFCQDTVDPIVVGPDDYSYVEGTTGHTLRWNASDLTLESYYIDVYRSDGYRLDYITGEFNSTGSFVEISIDGFSAGTYNITIIIQDRAYNHAYDDILITVTEPGGGGVTISFDAFLFGVVGVGVVAIVVIIILIKRRT